MKATFFQRGSPWAFRVKVKTVEGTKVVMPYALWKTSEEAERDVPLFVWFKGRKDAADPRVPLPHGQWFKSAKPDNSWNNIREYILVHGPKKVQMDRKRPTSAEVRNRQRRRLVNEKRNKKAGEVQIPIPPAGNISNEIEKWVLLSR